MAEEWDDRRTTSVDRRREAEGSTGRLPKWDGGTGARRDERLRPEPTPLGLLGQAPRAQMPPVLQPRVPQGVRPDGPRSTGAAPRPARL
ncbi:MAG: hypothetical protein QOC57_1160, partial [Ilumatobacteraceae bacterium]